MKIVCVLSGGGYSRRLSVFRIKLRDKENSVFNKFNYKSITIFVKKLQFYYNFPQPIALYLIMEYNIYCNNKYSHRAFTYIDKGYRNE